MEFTKNGKVAVLKKGISRLNGQIFTDTFKTEHRDVVNPKLVTFLPMVGEKGDKDLFFINDTAILFQLSKRLQHCELGFRLSRPRKSRKK